MPTMNHPEFYECLSDIRVNKKKKEIILPKGHKFYRIEDTVYTTYEGVYIEYPYDKQLFNAI